MVLVFLYKVNKKYHIHLYQMKYKYLFFLNFVESIL